ncbi:hypothetical protein [Microcoleus sp. AT3-D2]|uniref:hypothetical protein n=1 Tax=Microcoleus sp. AT3-D2 TaxID=2818612 RepID=UPI002FCEF4DC
MNWLTTAHLVGSPADMYGLTLHAVEHYIIVTKLVLSIAHMTDKSIYIQGFAKFLSLLTKKEWDARAWKTLVYTIENTIQRDVKHKNY